MQTDSIMREEPEVIRDKYHPVYAASDVTLPQKYMHGEYCRDIKISFRTETAEPESLEMDTSKKEANK